MLTVRRMLFLKTEQASGDDHEQRCVDFFDLARQAGLEVAPFETRECSMGGDSKVTVHAHTLKLPPQAN
jgi:hypothetical protein